MFLTLALSAFLAQSDAAAAVAVPAAELSAADRSAAAAEKAALAAEKAAEAAMRIADMVAPVPATAAAAADDKKDKWIGNLGVGLTFITGNSQTLTMTGSAAADRKWEVWSLGIRANGAYGLANPDTNAGAVASITARRASATIRTDRSFGGFAAIFALAASSTT